MLISILVIISTIVNGFVLKILWFWFVVPTFNLDPLNFGQALGLSLVISFLTSQYIEYGEEKKYYPFLFGLFKGPFCLLIGFLYKILFM